MATIIDALVVELGLDPTKFTRGQSQAVAAAKKAESELLKTAKNIEHSSEKLAVFFEKLKHRALEFTAILLGGRGLEAFTEHIVTAGAAAGRFSQNFGVSIGTLGKWSLAVEATGGSAKDAQESIQRISNTLQAFSFRGDQAGAEMLAIINQISQATGVAINPTKLMRGEFEQLGDALSKLADTNRPRARFIAEQLGLTPGMVNLLIQGSRAWRQAVQEAERRAPRPIDIQRATELEHAWRGLLQVGEQAGTKLFTGATGSVAAVIDRFAHFLEERNWEEIGNRVGEAIEKLAKAIGETNWSELSKEIKLFFTDIAGALGQFIAFLDKVQEFKRNPGAAVQGLIGGGIVPGGFADTFLRSGIGGLGQKYLGGGGNLGVTEGLNVKPGAGFASDEIRALAGFIQANVPGLNRFTSFNDEFHRRLRPGSAHVAGRALDFTLKDPTQAAQVANQIKALLAARGVNATVLNEGNHIHVQFPTGAAPAVRALTPGLPALGAGVGAATPGKQSSSQVTINQLTINTKATNAEQVAAEIGPALQRYARAGIYNIGVA